MANIRADIINWPGERIPFISIMNRQNTTELSSKINFLGVSNQSPGGQKSTQVTQKY